jgi:hypothetical protein
MYSSELERVAVPPSTVVAPGVGIIPYVLLPLAGPEEFDLEVGTAAYIFLQSINKMHKHRTSNAYLRLCSFFLIQRNGNQMMFCVRHTSRRSCYYVLRATAGIICEIKESTKSLEQCT